MRKTTRTVALFAMLSMLAVGCQKENIETIRPDTPKNEENSAYSMYYIIDGVLDTVVLHSATERTAFFNYIVGLTEQGYVVSVYDDSYVAGTDARDVVTFSTTVKEKAVSWADDMTAQGYKVTISYDSTNGVYNCVAIK